MKADDRLAHVPAELPPAGEADDVEVPEEDPFLTRLPPPAKPSWSQRRAARKAAKKEEAAAPAPVPVPEEAPPEPETQPETPPVLPPVLPPAVVAGEKPEDPWAPIGVEKPPPLPVRVRLRGRRLAWPVVSGVLLVCVVAAAVIYVGERQRRSQVQDDLARTRAQLAIAQSDRAEVLRRAAAATQIATTLAQNAASLSDVARQLEAALGDELALQDSAVKAPNDAGAALEFGNVTAGNEAISRLNVSVADQQRKLTEIRGLLDEFDRRRAQLSPAAVTSTTR